MLGNLVHQPADRGLLEHRVRKARPPWAVWIAAALVAGALVLVGFAEAGWLHDLPRDQAARVTVLVLPATAAESTDVWRQSVARLADETVVLGGQAPRMSSSCVLVHIDGTTTRRAVLLTAVMRSSDGSDPHQAIDAWSQALTRRGGAAWPGVHIAPPTGVTYEPCTD